MSLVECVELAERVCVAVGLAVGLLSCGQVQEEEAAVALPGEVAERAGHLVVLFKP